MTLNQLFWFVQKLHRRICNGGGGGWNMRQKAPDLLLLREAVGRKIFSETSHAMAARPSGESRLETR